MSEHRLTRRQLLRQAGIGLGAAAVASAAGALPVAGRTLLGGGAGGDRIRLARVWPATAAQRAAVWAFDDTHMAWADGSLELLLWPGDLPRLDALGVRYQVTVDDLVARDAELRDAAPAPVASGVPGAVYTYRRLGNDTPLDEAGGDYAPTYYADMQHLAATYPDKVRMFALPVKSLEGRTIYGLEICSDVARNDGRPVFYMDGLHHAREWPSGELTIMFGFDLVESYGKDARITAVVDNVRTVLVPVQNPDGFVRSRDHATSQSSAYGPVTTPLAVSEFEYHRKNLRRHAIPENGTGVDTNRNYGLQWGGDGSSGSTTSQTYRGAAPFSEPEAQSVRALLASIHAITLNSNHTYGRLILRPPGARFFGTTPDDELMSELGARMRAHNNYTNQYSWQLYDTTGTTMDWGYGAHGTLSYTFEHGTSFHPTYGGYITQAYTTGGNREAFLVLAEAAGKRENYSVVSGRAVDADGAPLAAEIRVGKAFDIPLWRNGNGSNPTGQPSITEVVDTRMGTEDGDFDFAVNPSRRPYEPGEGVPYTVEVVAADGRSAVREVVVERGATADLGDVTLT